MPNKSLVIFRPFEWMEVKQEVDSLLYNATDLLKAYNAKTGEEKRIDKYLDFSSTKEYIEYLRTESKTPWEGDLKILSTKKWKYGGTWMNQYLLVDFMMWLSPELKHKAIDFILHWQELAFGRNKIKEGYKRMCIAIAESGASNYRDEATMLNVLVSGSPSPNQRARYGEDKMDMMDDMQKSNATMIRLWLSLEDRKNALIKEYL
jgi:hypothetical protein